MPNESLIRGHTILLQEIERIAKNEAVHIGGKTFLQDEPPEVKES